MTDSEKIEALLNHYNLTTSGFAAKIGLSEEKIIDKILNTNYKISRAVKKKISLHCEGISIYWLYTGEGLMIVNDYKNKNIRPMTDGEKIECILNELMISASKFAETINVKKQTIYDIQRGKCRISRAVQKKIMDAYPNINRAWLIAGEGGIYNVQNGTQIIGDNNIANPTANVEVVVKLETEIALLKKDVELWKIKYDTSQQIIENQKMLIDLLNSNSKK